MMGDLAAHLAPAIQQRPRSTGQGGRQGKDKGGRWASRLPAPSLGGCACRLRAPSLGGCASTAACRAAARPAVQLYLCLCTGRRPACNTASVGLHRWLLGLLSPSAARCLCSKGAPHSSHWPVALCPLHAKPCPGLKPVSPALPVRHAGPVAQPADIIAAPAPGCPRRAGAQCQRRGGRRHWRAGPRGLDVSGPRRAEAGPARQAPRGHRAGCGEGGARGPARAAGTWLSG
jgi:hypothetical protein